MTVTEERKPRFSRRIVWLGVFVVLLVAGYTAGWFYLADMLEKQARAVVAALNGGGVSAECANPTARGYPFRIGLYCDRVAFADQGEGIDLSAGSFRSAGQIYDPMRFVAELDGPAKISLPTAAPFAVNWGGLRASVRLAEPLPSRVSLEGKALAASLASGAPLAAVEAFEAHMRPNGEDLDLAVSFDGLALDRTIVDGRNLPAFSAQSDLSIKNGVALVDSGAESLRGQSGTLRTLALSVGPNTGMTVSGPFSIGSDGLIDADLKVSVRDPGGLAAVLGEAFPDARDTITASFSGLAALGKEPSLPLKIAKGKATLGFIPLGELPPL
jgi:hypothetical protein